MGEHALLAASASHRWMNCPPSARLCQNYKDKGSDYAAEGTDAHTLCEYKIRTILGIQAKDPTADLSYYNEEMEECANGYAAYILELVETAKQKCIDPIVLIEQRLDFSRYVEDGFGTGDCIIVADGAIRIVDYKHGKGLIVEAERNPQIMLYALGALEIFDRIYDIVEVAMTIYQPRRSNVSTYVMSKDDLCHWAEEVLKPAAVMAFDGQGSFQCGEWCGFCKAKHVCRERAEHKIALAQYDFKLPPLLEDAEVEEILVRIDDLISWASDIKDYALQQALSGKEWNGWKLVEGRATRRYTDEAAVAEAVRNAGYNPYEQKVIGITGMQKTLGKARFDELLSPYVTKPQGKPTLVQVNDKRPEMNMTKNDFMEEADNE